jgi:Cdc6-like AAA superfamily ATPase
MEAKPKANGERLGKLRTQIFHVFLPGTPIRDFDFFAGRKPQMNAVTSAIMQPGRHAILFGERGVGKTSLAQVLVDLERNNGFRTLKDGTIDCDESDDFSSLWHKVFCDLPYDETNGRTVYLDAVVAENLDTLISPDDVRVALSKFAEPLLIVLDEIDQLKDEVAKSLLSATIKNLSNHRVNATLLLVGVADSVNDLIVEQKSAERALVQVHMPRMSPPELFEIIDKGLEKLGMTIDSFARIMAVTLSQRFPFYAHSFGLYSGLKAIDDSRTNITRDDVFRAILDVVLNSENVRQAYFTATKSTQSKSRYDAALIACALSDRNEMGFFPAAEMCKWMSALSGKKYDIARDIGRYVHYLSEFCEPKRGGIIQRVGAKGNYFYRFADPLMQPFVFIKAFGEGKLSEQILGLFAKEEPRLDQTDLPF